MNVYEAIAARRTIRDFGEHPIERDVLLRILDAGMMAPSHDHLREWHFVVVDDPKQREALVRFFLTERTRDELEAMLDGWGMTVESQRAMYLDAVPKQGSMLLTAGALVIPCFRQPEPLLGEKTSLHELNAFASIWTVLENVLIAAASEGIFGVTKIVSRPEERDHIRATLGIPEDYEIPCYLAIGRPSENAVWNAQIPVDSATRLYVDRWEAMPGGERAE
ncbi:nitroreductase family protein [Candidatus Bipolaricaulota bacterium]|nr:nitroreductase family protein [Candidatus Bipolaricaulota bacterium]